jgi:hypothetical protein
MMLLLLLLLLLCWSGVMDEWSMVDECAMAAVEGVIGGWPSWEVVVGLLVVLFG